MKFAYNGAIDGKKVDKVDPVSDVKVIEIYINIVRENELANNSFGIWNELYKFDHLSKIKSTGEKCQMIGSLFF